MPAVHHALGLGLLLLAACGAPVVVTSPMGGQTLDAKETPMPASPAPHVVAESLQVETATFALG